MKYFFSFLAGGIVFALFYATVAENLNLPTKVVSTSTGKCVYVLTPQKKLPCSYLKEDDKYHTMYIQ